jgi:glycosyltransferase involved in cell wall biosynthesis
MSIGMLEAMARGRSIVAADVPGAAEALDGDGGAIVPREDAAALAAAIADRLGDPSRADAEGRAARRRAEEAHDIRAMTEAVGELYDAVLSSNREPTPL